MKAYLYFVILMLAITFSCTSDETDPGDSEVTGNMQPIEDGKFKVLMGEFVEDTHPTMGKVEVNAEHMELTITNFKTDDGPVLELYLANDLKASKYVTLGELKGLEGDFAYDLPSNINFETYKYLMVWCVDFSVSFGHAVLE